MFGKLLLYFALLLWFVVPLEAQPTIILAAVAPIELGTTNASSAYDNLYQTLTVATAPERLFEGTQRTLVQHQHTRHTTYLPIHLTTRVQSGLSLRTASRSLNHCERSMPSSLRTNGIGSVDAFSS